MDAEQAAKQVPQFLEGLEFPAPKSDIIGQAEKEQAHSNLVSALREIPEGVYNSASEVAEHMAGKH